MIVARVPFQPICDSTDPRVTVNPYNLKSQNDIKFLLISYLGIKTLANLCLTSIHWNHLVADDRVWVRIAHQVKCPLQKAMPFYRQVVYFVQNFRDKLLFIDRYAYFRADRNSELLSPLALLTRADLENKNEEKTDSDPTVKRARLENGQNEEGTNITELDLRGLTINQVRYLQKLKKARDRVETGIEISEDGCPENGTEFNIDNMPRFDKSQITDVQSLIAKAKEFKAWFNSIEGKYIFQPEFSDQLVEPLTEGMTDGGGDNFHVEMINDKTQRDAYLVSQFHARDPKIPAPEWIHDYLPV